MLCSATVMVTHVSVVFLYVKMCKPLSKSLLRSIAYRTVAELMLYYNVYILGKLCLSFQVLVLYKYCACYRNASTDL
jgi:hypothetical protein